MTNMKNLVTTNRTITTALKAESFSTVEEFKNWKSAVEALRIATSNYASANRANLQDEVISDLTNDVFTAYKVVLSAFTNKSIGEKVKPQSTDLNTLITFVGTNRKTKDSTDGKQFLPVSGITFRKSVEDFISDRITSASYITAEDIEAEKVAKREARKAERKAKKDAEKAKTKVEKEAQKNSESTPKAA